MTRRARIALLTLLAVFAVSGDAMATSVTSLTVDNKPPSDAAGARTTFVLSFTATSALSGALESGITIGLSGADASDLRAATVRDNTTAQDVGYCYDTSTTTVFCYLSGGKVINAGDAVTVTLNGVVNPNEAGSYNATVHTSADIDPAIASFSVADANPISGVTVDNASPSAAAGARTTYLVSFVTSATGGLSGDAGSEITIDLPPGSDVTDYYYGSAVSVNGTNVGYCYDTATTTLTCYISGGKVVNADATVTVTLNGVRNQPDPGIELTATVDTTSDTSAISNTFDVVANNAISGVTVDNASPSAAAGARTTYLVSFVTSATGGLSGDAGSEITIDLPPGSDATDYYYGSTVSVNGTNVGYCYDTATTTVTCYISGGKVVNADATVTVTLSGVRNQPDPGIELTATVDTTSDTSAISNTFDVVANNAISGVTVDNASPSAAAGARTTYLVSFVTSATGGLSDDAGSEITINLPPGSDATDYYYGSTVSVNGTNVGYCYDTTTTSVTCYISSGEVISANAAVTVTLNGVRNPPDPATELTATVDTTSDTSAISNTFNVVANNPVQSAFVQLTDPAPSATATYTVTLTTSVTGALSGDAGSTITIELPAGTDASNLSVAPVQNLSTAQNVGYCYDDTTTTVICYVSSGKVVNAGDTVAVTLDDVTNPAGGTIGLTADVLTTSDTRTTSSTYGTAPGGTPTPTPTPTPTVTPTPTETPAPAAPQLVPREPVAKSPTSLTLAAVINPRGLPTTMHFEYGTDAGSPSGEVTFVSTEEQPVGSDNNDHTVTVTVSGLLPNATYRYRAVATNSAGTSTTPDQTAETAADPPPPPPVLGRTINLKPVSGVVFIQDANGNFVPLTQADQIPPGAVIDARNGALQLTSATTRKGKTQKGVFSKGLFSVKQKRKRRFKGLVELALASRDPKGVPLTKGCKATRSGDLAHAARKRSKRVLNLLRSRAKGKFRTKGKHAAATVRGTKWDLADRCDGTLTRVRRGSVTVEDFGLRKRVTVTAGKSYLARP